MHKRGEWKRCEVLTSDGLSGRAKSGRGDAPGSKSGGGHGGAGGGSHGVGVGARRMKLLRRRNDLGDVRCSAERSRSKWLYRGSESGVRARIGKRYPIRKLGQ